jgi:hypothetical protein
MQPAAKNHKGQEQPPSKCVGKTTAQTQTGHPRGMTAAKPPQTLERVAGRLAGAVAEVYCGTRPAQQLRPFVSHRALLRLTARASRRPSANAPIRSVLSVHVATVTDSAVEICAVVQGRQHAQAVAMKLRPHRDSWVATAVEIR